MLKRISLFAMAALYVFAGLRHFTHHSFYLAIMPPYIPAPAAMVCLSGMAEILLGLLLLVPRVSRLAAWGVIALLIAVFPANIYMWMADVHPGGIAVPGFFHPLRFIMQGVLIAWAYWHTKPSVTEAHRVRTA